MPVGEVREEMSGLEMVMWVAAGASVVKDLRSLGEFVKDVSQETLRIYNDLVVYIQGEGSFSPLLTPHIDYIVGNLVASGCATFKKGTCSADLNWVPCEGTEVTLTLESSRLVFDKKKKDGYEYYHCRGIPRGELWSQFRELLLTAFMTGSLSITRDKNVAVSAYIPTTRQPSSTVAKAAVAIVNQWKCAVSKKCSAILSGSSTSQDGSDVSFLIGCEVRQGFLQGLRTVTFLSMDLLRKDLSVDPILERASEECVVVVATAGIEDVEREDKEVKNRVRSLLRQLCTRNIIVIHTTSMNRQSLCDGVKCSSTAVLHERVIDWHFDMKSPELGLKRFPSSKESVKPASASASDAKAPSLSSSDTTPETQPHRGNRACVLL